MSELVRASVSLFPVLVFLSLLIALDSYELVPLRAVLRALAVGVLAAVVCLHTNVRLMDALGMEPHTYAKFLAPGVEELLKGGYVVCVIRSHRVGFAVDAAVHGFAAGTGFALVENVYFLLALDEPGMFLWVVRGLGTATLHGSTTAILAILSKGLADRRGAATFRVFLPGFGLAVLLHSLFNQFMLPPAVATAVILTVLPPVVIWVYSRSEKGTRSWLGEGFDADVEVLELIESGEIRESPAGRYLESLRHRFPPVVVADMLCLLQVHHELAIRAKAILLARESGLELPVDEGVRRNLRELEYLEGSIGKTGRLALLPLLRTSGRDLWQLCVLGR